MRATLTVAQLQSACVLYVVLWGLYPPLAIDTHWRIVLAGAFAGWFALEGLRNGFARLANWPAALVLAFFGYTALVQLLMGGPADVVRAVQLHILAVCALMGIAYRGARMRELEWLAFPVLAVFALTLATTLHALATDPHAARTVVRTSPQALALMREGVGGYQLIYACAVSAPVLALLVLRGRRGGVLGLAIAATVALAFATVLAAGYGIALVTLCAGVLVGLVVAPGRARSTLLRLLTALAALTIAIGLLDPFLAAAESLASGTKYALKLGDLRHSIALGESVGTVSDRTTRYLRSLSLFAQSPLLGVLAYDDLGKHSQILDSFARYGAAMGAAGLFMLVRLPALLLAPLPRASSHAPLVLMTTLAIALGLNNATAALGAMVFIVLPLLTFAHGRRTFRAGRVMVAPQPPGSRLAWRAPARQGRVSCRVPP